MGYIVGIMYMYPILYEVYLTFKVGKTQFRGLCLSLLSGATIKLGKERGGAFHFEAVPLKFYNSIPKSAPYFFTCV